MSETAKINSYRDLLVWQESMDLAVTVYRLSEALPQNEMYGLTAQLRRASTSVPANIAEGYGREVRGSYVQFLRIAQGSLKELETHILIAERVSLISSEIAQPTLGQCESVGKKLRGLIRSLQKA